MPNDIYRPYFYIIQHKKTKMYYAGSSCNKESDPSKFLSKSGYKTSSKIIKKIIKEEGIEAFQIRTIKLFQSAAEAYRYEKRFLEKVDARNNDRFYNLHNNESDLCLNTISNKLKWYTNGKCDGMFPENKQPEGWISGRLVTTCKGKKLYTDGNDFKMFSVGKEPIGWELANGKLNSGENNPMFGKSCPFAGKVACTNGTETKYFDKQEIPEGFRIGRTDDFKQKRSNATKGENNPRHGSRGEFWYNNGEINKLCVPGSEPPGFTRGFIKSGKRITNTTN